MNIEEAILYLEHTSKDDFNLEEHQKENRYQAIQVVLKEIERLKELCDKYEEEHKTVFEEWKKTISIIDELEIDLYDNAERCKDNFNETQDIKWLDFIEIYNCIADKLQELRNTNDKK